MSPTRDTTVPHTELVVEDEVLIRMMIAQYLRDCGYRVVETANADEALIVLQAHDVRVDIVFSDIEMPGTRDGFSLAQWMREHCSGVDVILAFTVPRAVNAAAELCEAGPLPKPSHPDSVASRTRRLLAARDRATCGTCLFRFGSADLVPIWLCR